MSTKITGLSAHNVRALQDIGSQLLTEGVAVETTSTTATFDASPRLAWSAVNFVLNRLPKGSTRHSLHAVLRRLNKAHNDAEAAE